MRLAVLGTGAMGAGMARSAAREGLEVTVWNRTRSKAEPLAGDGIEVADSIAEAVTGADVVVSILFDADSVLEVADEITGALGEGAVWLQSSTVGPDGIARIADTAGTSALLDAPMLGTKAPAEQGKLVPLVSGDPAFVEKARPVLDAVGAKTIVVGDRVGAASALKLVCNAWIGSLTAAVAQSIELARRLDLDPSLFLQAIEGGAVDTPYAQLKGRAMIESDWTPSFAVDGVRKDLGLITAAIESTGMDASVAAAAKALFDQASRRGHGQDDMAAVVTALQP